ncbi:hypothetical protein HS1genome_0617 [Sulfodiicoccus acidiphilus]|uniref:Uncharacterized protein n=1 Tax=Sulfodiicoccus acidiphilus TaxID=1670455 RepID=A0A348B226_9CREN|nr:transposase [Sulfodiicoccus acidiphilus]BBD72228.1 hypothetical protein HS1genome_0617 [Sulfodiicoccus acidiphilus]GGU02867.1 hypothetical protein GCM10007116_19860 [Sulfodiicoccus acidiphilus]
MAIMLSYLGVLKVLVRENFSLDEIKRIIVKLEQSERMYVSFPVERENSELPETNKVVATDLGIEKLLTTLDGEYVSNPRLYERALERVKAPHYSLGMSSSKITDSRRR